MKKNRFRELNRNEMEDRFEVMSAGRVLQRLVVAKSLFPDLFSGEYNHSTIAEFIGCSRESVTRNLKRVSKKEDLPCHCLNC